MYTVIFEFSDGHTAAYSCDTKDEIERMVDSISSLYEDVEIVIGTNDESLYVFWEDRFDFGW